MSSGKKVFISYASEDKEQAYSIGLSLRDYGFDVFFDRDRLAAGGGYDKTIRDEILKSSVFIFLVSRNSVTPGRYTLTELQFAREHWESPRDRVLPVILEKRGKVASEVKDLMTYLDHATWLEPKGNIAAEVSDAVAKMIDKTALMTRMTATFRKFAFGDYLKGGVGKSLAYTNADLDEQILRRHTEEGGRISVGELKDKLEFVEVQIAQDAIFDRNRALLPECLALVRVVGQGQQESGNRRQMEGPGVAALAVFRL